jgi:hypothetical protein
MEASLEHKPIGRGRRLTSILLATGACVALNVAAAPATAAQDNVFAPVCAEQEVKAITSLEDHGIANDVSAEELGAAGLMMLEARSACYAGKVDEAVALYQRAIDLKGRIAAKQ